VEKFKIDALICAGYKWLLGPYSLGLAYYSDKFNSGKPIEESWMNRKEASDFSKLTTYPEAYGDGAQRYNVGEFSNFVGLPMLKTALTQILEWQPDNIQAYCENLISPIYAFLEENKIPSDEASSISSHLMGIYLPASVDITHFMQSLKAQQIYASARGRSIRVSPHVYNTENDIEAFLGVFKNHI
jgi:selenocysteine lyase/cysteine desulfurase